MRSTQLLAIGLFALPLAAVAQTQSRDGMTTATQGKGATNNGLPAGSVNAVTGPQSRPAYPSGSTTPNPGAAMVATKPVPATGPAASPPGIIGNTQTAGGTGAKQGGPGVGQAATPAK